MREIRDIRVVVSIDFGTTFSGFAYGYMEPEPEGNETKREPEKEIITNHNWPAGKYRASGTIKIPTILEYDKKLNLVNWGLGVGTSRTNKKAEKAEDQTYIVELFKLHLAGAKYGEKPPLPKGLSFTTAINDYLTGMAEEIKDRLKITWGVELPKGVLLVITVPAGWDPNAQNIMRECCFAAGLITHLETSNLVFISEPEAAAMYCRDLFNEYDMQPNDSFMIVDCGGGTVDLTTRKVLQQDRRLSEQTESGCGYCGGSYVDQEFVQFVARELELSPATMATVLEKHGNKVRKMIKNIFWPIKFAFKDEETFGPELQVDAELHISFFREYLSDRVLERMLAEDWCLYLDFESVRNMFDPAISQILDLIRNQLDTAKEKIKIMFLVGGFSESLYVQKRIEETFKNDVVTIAVPMSPQVAVLKGGARYGMGVDVDTGYSKDIHDRVLKYTYGTDILSDWRAGDPPELQKNGKVKRFSRLAKRGQQFEQSQEYSEDYYPVFYGQKAMKLDIYYTDKDNVDYIHEATLLAKWTVDLPTPESGIDRCVKMALQFGQHEVKATAKRKDSNVPLEMKCDRPT